MSKIDETDLKQFIQTFLDIVEKQYSVEVEWSLRKKNQEITPLDSATETSKKLLSVKEAAKILGIGINRVYELIQEDPTFPYVILGDRNIKVLTEELPKWENGLLKKQMDERLHKQQE